MREFKNILTHQILALKNTIKVAFVKYTGPVIVSIIGVGFLLYYLFFLYYLNQNNRCRCFFFKFYFFPYLYKSWSCIYYLSF